MRLLLDKNIGAVQINRIQQRN